MCGIGIVIRIRFQSPRFRLRFQSPRFWLRFQSPRFWLRFQSPRFWLRFQSPQFWLRCRLHHKLTTNDSNSDSDSRIGVGIVVWFRLRSQNRPMSVSQRGCTLWSYLHFGFSYTWTTLKCEKMQNESGFCVMGLPNLMLCIIAIVVAAIVVGDNYIFHVRHN